MKWILSVISGAALALPAVSLGEQNVLIQFGSAVHDIEYDHARSRAYVSVPGQNKVVVINTNTWLPLTEISVSPSPRGVALALDGARLYVAKYGSGSVAVIDPDTLVQTEIDVLPVLGSAPTWDVIEAQPNRLYVSADPNSQGFAWIVQVELDNGNTATRVASDFVIRCQPTFEASRDSTTLYVGQCFSPESVYKLDLTQANAPVVADAAPGSVFGVSHMETNPSGSRVHLASGQILNATDLTVVGQVGSGLSRFDADPTRLFVFSPPSTLQTWNVNTQALVDSRALPCSIPNPQRLLVLPGETGFLVLGGTSLCGVADISPCLTNIALTCSTSANSVGAGAVLGATGEPSFSQNGMVLTLDSAPPGQAALFVFGSQTASLPFGDGRLCISPLAGIRRFGPARSLDAAGHTEVAFDFLAPPFSTGPIAAYSTWHFQAWYRDAQGPGGTGLNTSNGLRVRFCP